MRQFSAIESDIAEVKKQIHQLKKEKEAAEHNSGVSHCGRGVRAIFWGAVSSLAALCLGIFLGTGKEIGDRETIAPLTFGAIFMLFSLIAVIKFYKANVNTKPAMELIIFSGIVVAGLTIELLNISKTSEIIDKLLGDKKEAVFEWLGISSSGPEKGLQFAAFALLIPSALVFVGAVIKYIRQKIKKSAGILKSKELDDRIVACRNSLEKLEQELKDTKSEAARLFSEESAKESPDVGKMKELSDIGLNDAGEWLLEKKKSDDRAEGNKLFESEIAKEKPDTETMKKAAELGSLDASLWVAKALAVSCLAQFDDYAGRERQSVFSEVGKYAKKAKGCGDSKLRNVLETLAKTLDGKKKYPSAEEYAEASQTLRDIKKAENPSETDRLLTEKGLQLLIESNNSGKVSDKKKKSDPDDFEKRFDVSKWDHKYVSENTLFCVTWCDLQNEKVTESLKGGDYRKAREQLLDALDGLAFLEVPLNNFNLDYICCVTYLISAALDICRGSEWYNESNRVSLVKGALEISAKYDFESGELAQMILDMLNSGTSVDDFKDVFPKFPDELINKLTPLSEPYEILWKDVESGAAFG